MQNQKVRNGASQAPEKISPRSRIVQKVKIPAIDPSSTSSTQTSKTHKERSPKVVERKSPISSPKIAERKSPHSPGAERKRPVRLPELEAQLSEVQENLKKAKDELTLSERVKDQAQRDAEEARQQLSDISTMLEDSQKQLQEYSASEEIALKKVCEEKDQTGQSEAAPTQQHSELERDELQCLKEKMAETLLIVDDMKTQLGESKESEAHAQALAKETLQQLQTAKLTVEALQVDGAKSMENFNSLATELEQSKANVNILEGLVSKFNSDIIENGNMGESEAIISLKSEVKRLEDAILTAEAKHHEQQSRNAAEILTAYELVEELKCKVSERETELEAELKEYKSRVEDLKANLMDKETELQAISEENELLKSDTRRSSNRPHFAEPNGGATEDFEFSKPNERDDIMKLAHVSEQAERNSERVELVTEQLEAAQTANAEMVAELRLLKVQSDQWRKAAEAAAAMVSAGHQGKYIERTGSLDSNYNPTIGSPFSDDTPDDVLKKKNGNVLKKIGVLWKKPQK